MFCKHCGADNPQAAAICPRCGQASGAPPAPVPAPTVLAGSDLGLPFVAPTAARGTGPVGLVVADAHAEPVESTPAGDRPRPNLHSQEDAVPTLFMAKAADLPRAGQLVHHAELAFEGSAGGPAWNQAPPGSGGAGGGPAWGGAPPPTTPPSVDDDDPPRVKRSGCGTALIVVIVLVVLLGGAGAAAYFLLPRGEALAKVALPAGGDAVAHLQALGVPVQPVEVPVPAPELPAVPAEGGEAAPAEGGEAPPAEGGEAPPAEGGEAPPAEGGETPPAEGGETPPAEPAPEVAPIPPSTSRPESRERLTPERYISRASATLRQAGTRCIREAASRGGGRGTVVLTVALSGTGTVSRASVRSNATGDQELGRCLAGAMLAQRLSAPPPGVHTFDVTFTR